MLKRFMPPLVAGLIWIGVSGCDSGDDHYSKLSDMVAERNEVRKTISDRAKIPEKKIVEDTIPVPRESQEEISSIILYEKEVVIVDSKNGGSIAEGIAYMNKQGRIVKIKILKNY